MDLVQQGQQDAAAISWVGMIEIQFHHIVLLKSRFPVAEQYQLDQCGLGPVDLPLGMAAADGLVQQRPRQGTAGAGGTQEQARGSDRQVFALAHRGQSQGGQSVVAVFLGVHRRNALPREPQCQVFLGCFYRDVQPVSYHGPGVAGRQGQGIKGRLIQIGPASIIHGFQQILDGLRLGMVKQGAKIELLRLPRPENRDVVADFEAAVLPLQQVVEAAVGFLRAWGAEGGD